MMTAIWAILGTMCYISVGLLTVAITEWIRSSHQMTRQDAVLLLIHWPLFLLAMFILGSICGAVCIVSKVRNHEKETQCE